MFSFNELLLLSDFKSSPLYMYIYIYIKTQGILIISNNLIIKDLETQSYQGVTALMNEIRSIILHNKPHT